MIKKTLKTINFQITERPKLNMIFLELNHKKGIFKNKRLRQSIRDRFIWLLNEDGQYNINTSFIPPGGVGYLEFEKNK